MLASVVLALSAIVHTPQVEVEPWPWPIPLEELQSQLHPRQAVLCFDLQGQPHPRAWLITQTDVQRRELADPQEVQADLEHWLDRLRRHPGPNTFLPTFRHSRRVAEHLLGDWQSLFLENEWDALAIVADQWLRDAPFCALALGPEEPSSEPDIVYLGPDAGVPTVTARTVGELLGRNAIPEQDLPFQPNSALLLGDQADLTWIEGELQGLRKRIGVEHSEILLGEQAAQAMRTLNQHSPVVLHVAAHGKIDHDDGQVSLQLGQHLLGPSELPQLDPAPFLVNLSACQSAAPGGFGDAFLAQGSRYVITSRWLLSDREAGAFNANLYQQLPIGPVMASLRARTMIRTNPRTCSPFYWATQKLAGTLPPPYTKFEARPMQNPTTPTSQEAKRIPWSALIAALSLIVFLVSATIALRSARKPFLGHWELNRELSHQQLSAYLESSEVQSELGMLQRLKVSFEAKALLKVDAKLIVHSEGRFEVQIEYPGGRQDYLTGTWVENPDAILMTSEGRNFPPMEVRHEDSQLVVGKFPQRLVMRKSASKFELSPPTTTE